MINAKAFKRKGRDTQKANETQSKQRTHDHINCYNMWTQRWPNGKDCLTEPKKCTLITKTQTENKG